jgi:hypothetical protein
MQRNRRCSSDSLDLRRRQPANKHLKECMRKVFGIDARISSDTLVKTLKEAPTGSSPRRAAITAPPVKIETAHERRQRNSKTNCFVSGETIAKRVKSRNKGVVRGLTLLPIQPRHQVRHPLADDYDLMEQRALVRLPVTRPDSKLSRHGASQWLRRPGSQQLLPPPAS